MGDRVMCVSCGNIFPKDDPRLVNADRCIECGEMGVPADPDDTLTITITRHELRILTFWAGGYAEHFNKSSRVDMVKCINSITDRINMQDPKGTALNMRQELQSLADGVGVEVRVLGSGGEVFKPSADSMNVENPNGTSTSNS